MTVLYSCSCPSMSGHDGPVNLQQNRCYSLFCNFLSLYEWKGVLPLKVKLGRQSLEKELSCIFQAIGNILLQRFRASITKHRQQSTEVGATGIDPKRSQVCFSLLYILSSLKSYSTSGLHPSLTLSYILFCITF